MGGGGGRERGGRGEEAGDGEWSEGEGAGGARRSLIFGFQNEFRHCSPNLEIPNRIFSFQADFGDCMRMLPNFGTSSRIFGFQNDFKGSNRILPNFGTSSRILGLQPEFPDFGKFFIFLYFF